jgi:hypothetical protein
VTDVEWALRDLLWLAAWNAGDGPDVADANLASRHARFLNNVVKQVRRHHDQTVLGKAKNSPVRARDGILLDIDYGIRCVLATCKQPTRDPKDKGAAAKVVDRVKFCLDAWHRHASDQEISLPLLQREMKASEGIGGIASWITDAGGPAEASARLLDKLRIIGRTRLVELRASYGGPDNNVEFLLKRRYGHSGIQSSELREFAMRLVGCDDKAIAAAQAKQPEPLELDFFFGTWLC